MTHLFLSLEALTHALLDKGNLIRGAVVKGRLYHDQLSVFSDALVSDPDGRMNQIHRFHLMAAKIQEQFDASVDNPRVFEKVQWFARYWNETVWQFGGIVHRIRGPGVTPVPEEVRSTWEPENWR